MTLNRLGARKRLTMAALAVATITTVALAAAPAAQASSGPKMTKALGWKHRRAASLTTG
jgi:hypothetical protein